VILTGVDNPRRASGLHSDKSRIYITDCGLFGAKSAADSGLFHTDFALGNSQCLRQDTPGVEMFSQVSQIFAVLNDVLKGEEAKQAMAKSLAGGLTPCSLPMVFYQLRALEKTGLYELSNDIMERWRTMLKLNLSTTLEHDSPNQQRSDCHAWASIPMYEMAAVMLGIRPAEPGYASVSFSPVPGWLEWAEGDVITPKGMIHASWKKENGEIVKTIDLPEGLKTV
jgi:hypothetical protein